MNAIGHKANITITITKYTAVCIKASAPEIKQKYKTEDKELKVKNETVS